MTVHEHANTAGDGQNVTAQPKRSEIETELAHILASPQFRGSARSREFLEFVVTETLDERAFQINQRTIAIKAFGYTAEFDPNTSPIVRVAAARLRRSLEAYNQLSETAVRIDLPPGGYIPRIQTRVEREVPSAAIRADAPGIAVVTFENHGCDPSVARLPASMTESLAMRLAAFIGLRIVGPIPDARDEAHHISPKVVDEFDIHYVVRGSVRCREGTLRVTARLTLASTGESLWSQEFDRTLSPGNALEIEDDVAMHIAAALGDYRGAIHAHASRNPQAHEALLLYFHFLKDASDNSFVPAIEALERAHEQEPRDPTLMAILAAMYVHDTARPISHRADSLDRAETLARRASAALPLSAHAAGALAVVELQRGRVDSARREVERMARLSGGHPTLLASAGIYLWGLGDFDRGIDLIRTSITLNPDHPGYFNLWIALDDLRCDNNELALHDSLHIDMPGLPFGPMIRAIALNRGGRRSEAIVELDAVRAVLPDFDQRAPGLLAQLGVPAELADRIIDELGQVAEEAPRAV